MKTFISGGCKNGKSYYALKAAEANGKPLYYIATMVSADNEDDERIARHKAEREGLGFTTLEIKRDIDKLPPSCDLNGSFLLDSVTALLANEMFSGGEIYYNAYEKVICDIQSLIKKVSNIVIVSDYIYSDAFLYDSITESYRKGLGLADRAIAAECDHVAEVTFGNVIVYKVGATVPGRPHCAFMCLS